jgi:hypothetical protein
MSRKLTKCDFCEVFFGFWLPLKPFLSENWFLCPFVVFYNFRFSNVSTASLAFHHVTRIVCF